MNDAPNRDATLEGLMKLNGSAADADVAHPPGVTVPEALSLPIAGAVGSAAIGRIAGSVVARAIVISGTIVVRARRDRAADDGTADDSGGDTRTPATAPGMRRCRGRNGQRGDGSKCHQ